MAIDPVCGATVEPGETIYIVPYRGRDYMLCSQECEDEFRSAPQEYSRGIPGENGIAARVSRASPEAARMIAETSEKTERRLERLGCTVGEAVEILGRRMERLGITFALVGQRLEMGVEETGRKLQEKGRRLEAFGTRR